MVWGAEGDNIKNIWFFSFIFLLIFSFLVFLLSIFDILMNVNVPSLIFILYMILFGAAFIIFLLSSNRFTFKENYIKTFTKTLYGGLYHFQCPSCKGIFAIKESMYNTKGETIITCPDCGHLGKISSSPPKTIGLIPEKKSKNVLFKCLYCGESLKIWAEGTDIYPKLKVFSCPYCGREKRLKEY